MSDRARRFVADNSLVYFRLADPPDTVKARLQIQEGGPNRLNYKGTFDAFVKVCAWKTFSLRVVHHRMFHVPPCL